MKSIEIESQNKINMRLNKAVQKTVGNVLADEKCF